MTLRGCLTPLFTSSERLGKKMSLIGDLARAEGTDDIRRTSKLTLTRPAAVSLKNTEGSLLPILGARHC